MASFLKHKKMKQSDKRDDSKISNKAQSHNWYKDAHQRVRTQRNLLFLLSVGSLVFLFLLTTYVSKLHKTKIFEPYVLEVESRTGIIRQIDQNSVQAYQADNQIIDYFVRRYIRGRESYNFADYDYFYNTVTRVFSSKNVYGAFLSSLRGEGGALNERQTSQWKVEFKTVKLNQAGKKKVQVRFEVKEYKLPDMAIKDTKHYLVTLNYDFKALSLSEHELEINPLGFQVTSYRRDKDAL